MDTSLSIACPLCNHQFQFYLDLPYLDSAYSSLFPPTPSTKFQYAPSSCPSCGLNVLINDTSIPILGSLNPSITYKEPTDHISSIALHLSRLVGNTSFNIVSTSPKNDLLINSLLELNPSCTTTACYDFIPLPPSNGPAIICLTRIIEHINSYSLLDSFLRSCNEGDIVYLEILDFITLYSQGNFSFLWNERVNYPSKQYLLDFFSLHHFYPYSSISFPAEEPFHSIILIKRPSSSRNSFSNKPLSPQVNFNINHICKHFQDRMSAVLSSVEEISFYGIGQDRKSVV